MVFAFEILDRSSLFVAEENVIGRARDATDNREIQATCFATKYRLGTADAGKINLARSERGDRRWPTANQNRLDLNALRLEESARQRHSKGQLAVPCQTDKNHPDQSFFLRLYRKRRSDQKDHNGADLEPA